ncbi:MAG: HipA domain-containing protein [Bacteroidaceae bacterium]|nr:HipA domain-containing protein [Bacteroidaceae bacterium]
MKPLFSEYSQTERALVFGGENISPILPYRYKAKGLGDDVPAATGSISVSGAQPKLGVCLKNGQLRIAEPGEQSTHILKPCAGARFALSYDMPANELFCMNMVASLFKIPAAPAALCFFNDGVPAYLTKRFDLLPNGYKRHVEDIASLSETEVQGDSLKKYQGSYEQLAAIIAETSSAPLLDLRTFFKLVLVNYLLCNGDAHAKNFSMMDNDDGAWRLAPAYDILNTRLHVTDSTFAMGAGLFTDGRECPKGGMKAHFTEWAECIGLTAKYAVKEINRTVAYLEELLGQLKKSYLTKKAQSVFQYHVRQRFLSLK